MYLAALVSLALLFSVVDAQTGSVAFSVGQTVDQNYGVTQTIVYNTVFINDGRGYNNRTGIFTAPKAGLYQFQIYGVSLKGQMLALSLYQNDKYVISIFGEQIGGFATGANSVLLRLKQGDRIQVKSGTKAFIYGRSNENYTTFSGLLIAPANRI